MNLDQFIHQNSIQKADAIVVRKKAVGLLSHYVIYLGLESEYYWIDDGGRHRSYRERGRRDGHLFIANMGTGVNILREQEVLPMLKDYQPKRINRFLGNQAAREAAIERALSEQNQENYNLILNNCEHFANYVQENNRYSQQSQNVGIGLGALLLVGLGIALFGGSKDDDDNTI